jgi:hypothetical protein
MRHLNNCTVNASTLRKLLLVMLFFVVIKPAKSQVSTTPFTFNSTGGSYDNPSSYYRFEWSISEMTMINTITTADSACRLLHGVLQPGTERPVYPQTLVFESGDYRIFPNPTTGPFELNFYMTYGGKMELQLADATGRVLETRTFLYDGVRRLQLFDLSRYANGLYYVIATLTPFSDRALDNIHIVKRSGLKVIKLR